MWALTRIVSLNFLPLSLCIRPVERDIRVGAVQPLRRVHLDSLIRRNGDMGRASELAHKQMPDRRRERHLHKLRQDQPRWPRSD
jgi:hypothetical protein